MCNDFCSQFPRSTTLDNFTSSSSFPSPAAFSRPAYYAILSARVHLHTIGYSYRFSTLIVPTPPATRSASPSVLLQLKQQTERDSGTDILVPELLPVGLAQSARITSRRTRFTLQAWHLVERFERFERSRWKQLISFNYRCSMHINLVGVVSLLSLCQLGNLSPCVATIQKT